MTAHHDSLTGSFGRVATFGGSIGDRFFRRGGRCYFRKFTLTHITRRKSDFMTTNSPVSLVVGMWKKARAYESHINHDKMY